MLGVPKNALDNSFLIQNVINEPIVKPFIGKWHVIKVNRIVMGQTLFHQTSNGLEHLHFAHQTVMNVFIFR